MATRIPERLLREAVELVEQHRSHSEAARRATNQQGGTGITQSTLRNRLRQAAATLGLEAPPPTATGGIDGTPVELLHEAVALMNEHGSTGVARLYASRLNGGTGISISLFRLRLQAAQQAGLEPDRRSMGGTPPRDRPPLDEWLARLLRQKPRTVAELCGLTAESTAVVEDTLLAMADHGYRVARDGDMVQILTALSAPPSIEYADNIIDIYSRDDDTFSFGCTSDNHIGSKYARLDVLADLYARFEAEGVQAALNAGNWIDGEARFNTHELVSEAHGLEAQLDLLVKHYPRATFPTYAVSGDDHEGWYAQKMGIDIGKRAEQSMRAAGRDDWHDVGYMEGYIRLINSRTGRFSVLSLVHPGGGSAYALSYAIQKIVESLEGGEKPAVGLYGHYHKLMAANIRNVWTVQTGTTQDQSSFMRKKKLEAHVGGVVLNLRQDPDTGAIVECAPNIIRYFSRSYQPGRWSHARPVQHTERSPRHVTGTKTGTAKGSAA